ncbi:ABC transporter permease [Candidatus Aminicenantes bacterium AH-873-B07]|jgi:phospholipid/cholesterol/gamma-HCH transport system permease protein|nr:ABC transporter permease [Candidatus Aminicenantes bacterium AH-873-B07]
MNQKKFFPRASIKFFEGVGEVSFLFYQTLINIFKKPWEKRIFVRQLEEIGINSLPVVIITAAFSGLVYALWGYIGFHRYIGPGSEAYAGPVITLGLVKELIPVLVGLMVAGRICSSIAAELGSMKVTEQIDALYTLGADPIKYLVVPRTLAAFLMLPLLTIFGDAISLLCSYGYMVYIMNVNKYLYYNITLQYIETWDIITGLIKASSFGIIIAIIGCYYGLKTEGGAQGVGKSTTNSVVVASILILIINFFWSKFLPSTLHQ